VHCTRKASNMAIGEVVLWQVSVSYYRCFISGLDKMAPLCG